MSFWTTQAILTVRSGSHAQNLAGPDSDEDFIAVAVPDARSLLGLEEADEMRDGQHVTYAARKFVRLALESNPNILEALFVRPEDVVAATAEGRMLLDARGLFLTTHAIDRFVRYAYDQLMRMKRHYKWIVEPPARPPAQSDFGGTEQSGRWKFPDFDAQKAYDAALKHWKNYQDWRAHRNAKRAALEERHGYDTKHAAHIVRLLLEGEEILRDGQLTVFRTRDIDFIRSVRSGGLKYPEVIAWADGKKREIEAADPHAALRREPATAEAERLLIAIHKRFMRREFQ